MMFDTPKNLEAALVMIMLYDRMYWELYSACVSAYASDNRRIHKAKEEGRRVGRSASGNRAHDAMKTCDAVVEEMRKWMQARDLGGLRPTELAVQVFRQAELATGDKRKQLFADLNALLDDLEPDEWVFAVALDGRWGREVLKRFCMHVARRLMVVERAA